MVKKLIMCAAVAGLLFVLAPAAQAATLFEEHFVDPQGESNPGWGRTAQEYLWEAPHDEDWVPGLHLAEYPSSGKRWQEQGAGTYSFNLSNLYERGDNDPEGHTLADGTPRPSTGVYPLDPPGVPPPDGDGWHFFGIHDGGNAQIYTTPGVVNIASAARAGTQFSMDFAATYNDTGVSVAFKLGDGNWYITDEIDPTNGTYGQASGGGHDHGCVYEWDSIDLDMETATFYDYSGDDGAWTIGPTPIAGLPSGDIVALSLKPDNYSNSSKFAFDNIIISTPTVDWLGGVGNWYTTNWSSGAVPSSGEDMIIDAVSADSVVTVAADFIGGGTGPAKSVFVGETNAAKLVVASGVTLEVTGETTAGEMGKIAIDNLATLKTGTAAIEADGRLISGVQGNNSVGANEESGVLDVQTADGLTLEDGAEAIQVDWLPLPPNPGDPTSAAASMFGGVYTVAKYTGTPLGTTGKTTNSDPDSNIGADYIKSVAYDVDLGAGVLGVQVTLETQGLGDTDLDADVDGDDLATFGLAWSPSGTDKTWFDGDFDFDGDIDGDDLAALGLAWAPGGITFPAGDIDVTTVPEPGTIIMLLIGMVGLLIYRKRR